MKRLAALLVAVLALADPAAAAAQNVLTIHCKTISHSAQVDPIVAYGVVPSAHLHDFVGSDATGAFSTADSLAGTSSSCKTIGDTAAYWFPQPTWNGSPTVTTNMGEYWQRPTNVTVAAPPHGMAFVAGDAHATAPTPHLAWSCGNGAETPEPRDCTGTTTGSGDLTADLAFPDCWDGSTAFDNPGGAGIAPSHFAYRSSGTNCPAGFPRHIAKLEVHVHFRDPTTGGAVIDPFNADGSLALGFASGPPSTFHGDLLNGWDQARLVAFIDGCVNRVGVCPAHA